jgi:enoyl-CoA hydratase
LCDTSVIAETARIGDTHVRVGLVAGDGGAVIWPQLIGYARAKEYLLTGDLMTATQAAGMGLINYAIPADELDDKVNAFADRLAAGATKAIRWTKMSVNIGLRDLAAKMMDASLAYEGLSNITPDHAEAVRAFAEKRPPVFERSK